MRKFIGLVACLYTLFVGAVWADPLSQPTGDVVLTVSGQVGVTNQDGAAVFDMDMLKAMPAGTYQTSTIWTEGEKTFMGVPLKALLEAVDADGKTVLASAINDYTVEIPVETVTESAPLIAYEMDGAAMSRRQKGPLWIVYPYDSDPAFRAEVIYSRSIWQLDRIEIAE